MLTKLVFISAARTGGAPTEADFIIRLKFYYQCGDNTAPLMPLCVGTWPIVAIVHCS